MVYNNTNNSVSISGRVASRVLYSHEVFGEKFYEFQLAVNRTSGTQDFLPVCVSNYLLDDDLDIGDSVTIKGQFRSYNKVDGEKAS